MTHRRFWLLVGVLLAALLLGSTVLAAVPAASNAAAQMAAEAKIEPLILTELAETGQTDFFIWMAEKADLSPAKALATQVEKGRFVFAALRATADRTQAEVKQALDAQGVTYQAFYIANKIFVRGGTESLVYEMAARPDVAKITANHPFQLPEPFINPNPPKQAPSVIEPNITFVNADDVWGLGYRGEGTVLAGNDTGLDWDHPALIVQYRGWDGVTADHNYNWWDATGTYPTIPNDGHGHGTHTSGTMVGDDGGANQIGMAPGARLIHCKNMTDFGSGDDFTFTECFEWDLAPWDLTGANPDPDMAPDAINNSWGYWGGNWSVFEDEIAALQAAGIAVEVSAGNEGPGCTTLRSPGDYDQVITTGSVNHAGGVLPGTLTGFSSRGPSILYPSSYIPDIMAPGENINSSLPGGGYSGPTWSGTSMSGPHVTGLIGLMWNASPALQGDIAETYDVIYDTAVRLVGQPGSNCGGDYTLGPNNDWGYGTIDALAAVNEAILRGGPNFRLTVDPEEVSICTPDDAVYTADLSQILGYAYPVDMSLTGNPAGTTATFAPNPVTPPGSTVLTVGNTGAAAAGTYAMTITGTGTDPETKTHSEDVVLNVFDTTPGGVALVSPADGATNVALAPTYEWDPANQAGTYDLEVASDPGFVTIVYTATVDGTSHTATANLAPETTYYWHVRAANSCGTGEFSATFSFTTRAIPPILLVDDDNNSPDVLSYYTEALDGLGAAYDIWDTGGTDNEPTATDLEPYTTVIWFTGVSFGGFAGPGAAAETDLGTWLEAGNCFMISAQDYFYDRGLTSFMQTYLGVSSATSDVGQSTVTGAGSVFGGMGPYFLSYPFTNWSDIINPDGTAETAFTGDFGDAAVDKDGGNYRTTFWGFPFEAVADVNDRMDLMSTTLDWCGTGIAAGTLEGTVTDADTGLGIEDATVTADAGSGPRSTTTGADGSYSMNLAIGTYDVTASATNYVSVTVSEITILTDTTTIQDFVLQGSSLTYSPPLIEEFMVFGDKITNTVTLTASGPLPVDFSVRIGNFGGPGSASSGVIETPVFTVRPEQQYQTQSIGLGLPSAPPAAPLAAGDVIQSWSPGIGFIWGNAYDYDDDTVWVSSPSSGWGGSNTFYEFTPDGTQTGRSHPYTWFPGSGPADAAYNANTGMLWQMDVATDDCIHEIDPASGVTGNTICPAFGISQRGLAYDPTTDTYFAGSWNDLMIHHFDSSGAFLEQVNVGLSIAGLAYNPDTQHLFVMVNAAPNPVYVLDAANNYAIVGQFNVSQGFGDYAGAGLEMDCDGYLWAVDQATSTVYQFESDETTSQCGAAVDWVYAVPDEGTVPMNGTATFDVVFDARSLYQVGDYTAELTIEGTHVNPLPTMPLTMHLSCPTCGFLDGSIYDDTTGLPLAADVHVTGPGGFDVTLTGETYNLAVQPGSYDFTVSANGYLSETATVVATQGVTTTTDFYLIPDVAILSYAPPAVEEYMEIGDVVTNTVTVTNSGAHELEYSVNIGGYGGPDGYPVSIPASNGDFPRGSAPASAGLAPKAAAPGGGQSRGPLFTIPTGAPAYGLE
ncbi:MAG: S8 family serine peptidase, partial [Chloroflexota bacterium]